MLFTLDFDVGVVHPYATIGVTLSAWRDAGVFEPAWPRRANNSAAPREVKASLTLAGNLAFVLITTDASLSFSPAEIAVAALATACDIVYDAAGGVPSPVKWSHVVSAVLGEKAARHVVALRERMYSLLSPLVLGDSAVFIHTNGTVGGVTPIPATHADVVDVTSGTPGGGEGKRAQSGAAGDPQSGRLFDSNNSGLNLAIGPSSAATGDWRVGVRETLAPVLSADDELPQLE